ncbi:MAG TPA: PQQ-binding-like beta-propeller repeat protein [Gemmataceae bacterium]|nr:PQQ-binding-like beta-propeller repeat protein [Gemmataceae bacterium]
MNTHISTLLALALLSTPMAARAENWPSWRGPTNNGISNETNLPTTWTETKNIAWKLTIPKGSSTPVIWGDRIFVTGSENKDLVLVSVTTDGKILWKRKIGPEARASIRSDEGNEASPTPSTDGKLVFTYVGTGEFCCFDFEGNQKWKFNAQKRYGNFSIQHGMHVTPLLDGDRLYLSLITNTKSGHWVIALDKMTGEEIWKINRESDARGESRESYASPILWKNGDEMNLVVLGADYTTGHSLKDGSEVWRLSDLNPKSKYSTAFRIIATPVAEAGELVVPTCRGGIVVALKSGAKGTIKAGSEYEYWRINRGAPDVPSPLIHDGLVYLPRENGVLICLDAKTGKQYYEERIGSGRYRSSPIIADGNIYLLSRDSGTVSVVKAGRDFKLISNNKLSENFTASPSVSGGRLYLRGFSTLYAIQESAK